MTRTFLSDPALTLARDAVDASGFPLYPVKVVDMLDSDPSPPADVMAEYDPHVDELWTRQGDGDLTICASVHEYAHAIFQRAIQGDKALQSKITPVLNAAFNTPEILRFEFEAFMTGDPELRGYVLNPNEVWARAVAQYVAKRSFPDRWEHVMHLDDGGLAGTQWSDQDFQTIAEVIAQKFPPHA